MVENFKENTISEEKILEDFILKNPELERLENLLGNFNVFEILNIVNAEIRHSNVLAWLFNPNSNHGLSESFLKQFLKHFISENKKYINEDISLFDFEIFDYSDVEIRREWNNIDLLIILNESSKKVVITIENKISTSEHGDQLERYRKIVSQEFKDFKKMYILLSPDEVIPSDENWICITYSKIADLIDSLLNSRKDMLSDSVHGFINQYNIILRRYLVGNSEIENICRSIYRKHQKALDLIFQYKPDLAMEISEYVRDILKKDSRIDLNYGSKTYINFLTNSIKNTVAKITNNSSESENLLYYEFRNHEDRLTLFFMIGPGEIEYRKKLLDVFKSKKELFSMAGKTLYQKYNSVYQKKMLVPNDYTDASIENLSLKFDKKWEEFCSQDLIKIDRFLDKIDIMK
jgi:hypothetical protein